MKKICFSLLVALSASSVAAAANKPEKEETKVVQGNSGNSGKAGKSGSSIGLASVADAKLAGANATSFAWSSTVNPANGNSSGFDSSFASYASADKTWTFLGSSNNSSKTVDGTSFAWSYNSQAGTWQITSSNAVVLDLVLAVHSGSESGAWLFNNVALGDDISQAGSFAINWTNNGGQTPGFSNFSLFARDIGAAPAAVSPVPEPETYAMMLAALGLITVVKRRRSV